MLHRQYQYLQPLAKIYLLTADPAARRVVPKVQKNTSLSLKCAPNVSLLMFSKSYTKRKK